MGNGSKINNFDDHWLLGVASLREHHLNSQVIHNFQAVEDLIKQDQRGLHWNVEVLTSLWDPEIVEKIKSIPLGGEDIRCWGEEPAVMCFVKPLYKSLLSKQIGPQLLWNKV